MSGKLTQEDRQLILEQCPKVLESLGVKNWERSSFIQMISAEVVGSTNHMFFGMQPKLKVRESKAWARAYQIVMEYLKANKATNTLKTIEIEFKQGPGNVEMPEPSEDFEATDDDFLDILGYQLTESEHVFETRVKTFYERLAQNSGTAQLVDEESSNAFLTAPMIMPQGSPTKDDSQYLLDSSSEKEVIEPENIEIESEGKEEPVTNEDNSSIHESDFDDDQTPVQTEEKDDFEDVGFDDDENIEVDDVKEEKDDFEDVKFDDEENAEEGEIKEEKDDFEDVGFDDEEKDVFEDVDVYQEEEDDFDGNRFEVDSDRGDDFDMGDDFDVEINEPEETKQSSIQQISMNDSVLDDFDIDIDMDGSD